MENAAKALVIAGGVLIAIMTLSLFLYGMTSATRIQQAQDEKKATEELSVFNMEYEAYNKRRLYGIDVITVINKAIEHNRKMQVSTKTDKYYINIKFVTSFDCKNELYKIDNTKEEKTETEVTNPNSDSTLQSQTGTKWEVIKKSTEEAISIRTGTYELGTFQANGATFVMDNNFIKKFSDGSIHDISATTSDGKYTYKLYSALTNFKRSVFACTPTNNVKYNSSDDKYYLEDETKSSVKYKDGRIYEITFVQINK